MRFAYADPPYPGMAHFYPEQTEVDHGQLVAKLCAEFDGWALSTASTTLRGVLAVCPDDVRVMAWVKPFASFKKGVRVAYAWEPVIVRGARNGATGTDTVPDWVSANITLERGIVGAKPDLFCYWVFRVLGLDDGDEFVDLFPGSGAVTAAWDVYRRQTSFLRPSGAPS